MEMEVVETEAIKTMETGTTREMAEVMVEPMAINLAVVVGVILGERATTFKTLQVGIKTKAVVVVIHKVATLMVAVTMVIRMGIRIREVGTGVMEEIFKVAEEMEVMVVGIMVPQFSMVTQVGVAEDQDRVEMGEDFTLRTATPTQMLTELVTVKRQAKEKVDKMHKLHANYAFYNARFHFI